MLDEVRTALRFRGQALDGEIQEVISACKAELLLLGIQSAALSAEIPEDALIRRAIVLYARAAFDFEGQGDRYQRAYDALKGRLSLAGGYRA